MSGQGPLIAHRDADPTQMEVFSDSFGPRPQCAWLVSSSVRPKAGRRQPQRETIESAESSERARSLRGVLVLPGFGLLEQAGDADQDVFAAVGGDELDTDREAVGVPVQREAD